MPYIVGMSTLTITAKGQVTLKKDVLRHLGVKPGDKIDVTPLPDGRVEVRAAPRKKRSIADLYGSLKREGQPTHTIEELNQFIADAWAGKR
jgi:AbrB family looped-hinge helix DNA binding protein